MEVLHESTYSAYTPYQRTITATAPAGATPTTPPLAPVGGSAPPPLLAPAAAHAGSAAQLGYSAGFNLS